MTSKHAIRNKPEKERTERSVGNQSPDMPADPDNLHCRSISDGITDRIFVPGFSTPGDAACDR